MKYLSTLRNHISLNLVLLSACTIFSYYIYGWIIVALYANMTKALPRYVIGVIFAVSAIIQYILQLIVTKYLKVSFKWIAVALTAL